MDDRELLNLARLAMEAEDLERAAGEAGAPQLRLVGGAAARPSRVRWMIVGGLTAAAASVALSAAMFWPTPRAAVPVPGPLAAGHEREASVVPVVQATAEPQRGGAGEQSIVLAVFRSPDGSCDCMQWKRHEWEGGKSLAEVGRGELMEAVMKSACTTSAERVVVVAFSGPGDLLPKTRDDAEVIASRLAAAPPTWHEDITSFASAALPDLPKGATVVARSLAMSR